MMMMEMMKVVSALVLFYCDCIDSSVKSPVFFFFCRFPPLYDFNPRTHRC